MFWVVCLFLNNDNQSLLPKQVYLTALCTYNPWMILRQRNEGDPFRSWLHSLGDWAMRLGLWHAPIVRGKTL